MPLPQPRLRRARDSDVDAWLDVVEAVAGERLWIGHEPPVDRAALAERLRAALADDTRLRMVAEAGGGVVGLLDAEEYHGIVSFGMMLLPEWRGRGTGGRLLDELVVWARSRGAHKLSLQVWPHNAGAIRLYERYGFTVEGRLRRHWRRASGELWDALVMGMAVDAGQPAPTAHGEVRRPGAAGRPGA